MDIRIVRMYAVGEVEGGFKILYLLKDFDTNKPYDTGLYWKIASVSNELMEENRMDLMDSMVCYSVEREYKQRYEEIKQGRKF